MVNCPIAMENHHLYHMTAPKCQKEHFCKSGASKYGKPWFGLVEFQRPIQETTSRVALPLPRPSFRAGPGGILSHETRGERHLSADLWKMFERTTITWQHPSARRNTFASLGQASTASHGSDWSNFSDPSKKQLHVWLCPCPDHS